MTNVIVNAIDVLGHEIDEGVVRISAADIQKTGGTLMLPEYHEQALVAGSTTILGVTPGKVVISIHWGINRTATFRVHIPDADEITLADLTLQKYDTDPAIVSQVTDAARRAEGAEVAAKTSETNAAGHATQTSDDRRQTGEDRTQTGLDRQAAAQSATDAATSATTAEGHKTTVQTALAGARLYSGTGSPSGRVSAPVGSIYTDTSVTAGAVRWLKTSGTGSTGWVVEYGDTGWRDLTASLDPARMVVGDDGYFRARRTERFVEYSMYNVSVVVTGNIYTVPAGFRVDNPQTVNAFGGSGFFFVSRWALAIGGVSAGYNLSFDREFVIRFNARPEEWPTTLPGTPT